MFYVLTHTIETGEWRQFLPTQVRFEGDSIRPGGHVQRSGLPRTHVYSQPPLRTEQSTDVPNTATATHVTQRHQTHKTLHYISSLLYYVNLILFTLLLVHLILLISPHHSHHPRSHHLSLPLPFTPHLKLYLSQMLSSIVTAFAVFNLYWIKEALAFVCCSFFFLYFFLATCARLKLNTQLLSPH